MSDKLSDDVGTRTSYELAEARTVLTRAETAVGWLDTPYGYSGDPDREAILAALKVASDALAPFRRTSRRRK